MAELLVRNPRKENQVIAVGVVMKQVKIATDDPAMEGELSWILEATTSAVNCDGDDLPSKWCYLVSFATVDEQINDLINQLCEDVCWDLIPDTTPPRIYYYYPLTGSGNIPLSMTLQINIEDLFPTAGINKDSIALTFKGFDVSDHLNITGNPLAYTITYTPGTKESG